MNELFENYKTIDRAGEQFKIKSEKEMFRFLRQFITLTETSSTPYKRKAGSYSKKAHYINGKKVNRQVYNYIKRWLIKQERK